MRCMHMETTTLLVRENSVDPKAFAIQATRLFGRGQVAHHREGLLLPFGPTTDEHDWPIRLLCTPRLGQLHSCARPAQPPQGLTAQGLVLPQRRHVTPRAA